MFCDGLADYLVGLTGRERPRLLHVGTASKEQAEEALRTYDGFAGRVDVRRLEFFPWPPEDLEAYTLEHDLIWVSGGNTANALAIWRVHGFDAVLRKAWERGVVLAGSSAGGICWFEHGITDSFGPQLATLECLGFLAGSLCPHYDDEERRRPVYHGLIRDGFPAGHAADAGVGLHYVGEELREVVACREGTTAYRVRLEGGEVLESPLPARVLD